VLAGDQLAVRLIPEFDAMAEELRGDIARALAGDWTPADLFEHYTASGNHYVDAYSAPFALSAPDAEYAAASLLEQLQARRASGATRFQ